MLELQNRVQKVSQNDTYLNLILLQSTHSRGKNFKNKLPYSYSTEYNLCYFVKERFLAQHHEWIKRVKLIRLTREKSSLKIPVPVLMEFEGGATRWRHRRWSSEKLLLLSLTFLAIVSPLIIDKREQAEAEAEEEPIDFSSYGPVVLVVLIIAVAISCYLDKSLTRFDPYWIYRVCGSSSGIVIVLMLLALVLKCKASPMDLQ